MFDPHRNMAIVSLVKHAEAVKDCFAWSAVAIFNGNSYAGLTIMFSGSQLY
jgi:hypothetical protein